MPIAGVPQAIGGGSGTPSTELFDRVSDIVEFPANVVEEMIEAHPEFIHRARIQDPSVVDQRLVGPRGGEKAVEVNLRVAALSEDLGRKGSWQRTVQHAAFHSCR